MEIEGDDGGFSKSRFEMHPVVSDQPGKRGRGWPLPVKEVVATNPFISDRGSFSEKDFKPSLLAAQNLAGFDPATNFFQRKIERINTPTRHLLLCSHNCFLYEQQHREKMMNNKFEGQTLTGNPIGNPRRHISASRALNMSYCFGQSARSIQKGCVVKAIVHSIECSKCLNRITCYKETEQRNKISLTSVF